MTRKAKIGGADIWQVEETVHKMPLSTVTSNEELISQLPKWMFPAFIGPDRQYDNVWQSWIVVVDGRVIVVDPCAGNGRNFPDYLPAHMLDTPYIERFAATGVQPKDVDYVFCTHLHMDHCGWNTELRNGRFVPTFPNARYIFVQREYDRWDPRRPDHKPVPPNAGTFQNSILPVVEAGLAEIVADQYRISPNLIVEPAHGHTIGHSMLHLATPAQEAYFTGDVFEHVLELLHPVHDDWISENAELAAATRRHIIETCIAKNAIMIAAHFPCPFGGHVKRQNGEVTFEPLAYQQMDETRF